ncbi:MAG TPA: hypothetical protein VM487_13880 [Phycisphaerae bacterium]|nr:hypothetical protein [Phycisphaerae bacterium]
MGDKRLSDEQLNAVSLNWNQRTDDAAEGLNPYRQLAALCWTDATTGHIEMDSMLADAFARMLRRMQAFVERWHAGPLVEESAALRERVDSLNEELTAYRVSAGDHETRLSGEEDRANTFARKYEESQERVRVLEGAIRHCRRESARDAKRAETRLTAALAAADAAKEPIR